MIHRHLYIFTLVLILPINIYGQVFSKKNRFLVAFNRGCNPMTVNITENDTFGEVTRQYYYFEGAGITNRKTFTYQDPGIYQIVQVVGVDGIDDKTDTLFVEVLQAKKPNIELQKCSNHQIFITSHDSYYDSVKIYFTKNDSVTLATNQQFSFVYKTASVQQIELNGLFNDADNICTQFFEEIIPTPSLSIPKVKSASIKETCKKFYSLYLKLEKIDTFARYRITLIQNNNSQLFDGFLKTTSLTIPKISFNPTDYCIAIEIYDPCNNRFLLDNNFCQSPSQLSLSPFETLYSSYNSKGVYINLDEVNIGTFRVYRRLEDENDEKFEFRSTQTGSFTDHGSTSRKYFYRIDYIDSCNQVLFFAETNPPFIDAVKGNINTYQVTFTFPTNSLTGISDNEYQVGTTTSQLTKSISTTKFTIQLDAKNGSPLQVITATSSFLSGTILKSNDKTIEYELIIHVPTAFTPNNDGMNDTLKLFGLPTKNATINIYNRWGHKVYSSKQSSPIWDGTINGYLANEGTYLYEIIFETIDGQMKSQKGTFLLIKK